MSQPQAGEIVHVIAPDMSGGGAEAVIESLAIAGRGRTRVIVLNQIAGPHDAAHPFVARLRQRDVAADEIRCGRRSYRAEARALGGQLAGRAVAAVHTHGYHADIVGYFATRGLGLTLVSTVHGYIRRSLKEHVYNVLDKRVLRRFAAIVAVSPAISRELVSSGIDPRRVHVVPNGLRPPMERLSRVEARRALGLPADGHVIGWVGRLSPEKGPDLFLKAFAQCNIPARAVMIGEGPESTRLETMVAALPPDVRERISLIGYRSDAGGILAAFDVLAVTSRTEGTPMVLLEAAAAGLPVVTFRVGGIPSLLAPDMAWLVSGGDVDAFAGSLVEALSTPVEAERRAATARTRLADAMSAEKWLMRVLEVYESAASDTGARRRNEARSIPAA